MTEVDCFSDDSGDEDHRLNHSNLGFPDRDGVYSMPPIQLAKACSCNLCLCVQAFYLLMFADFKSKTDRHREVRLLLDTIAISSSIRYYVEGLLYLDNGAYDDAFRKFKHASPKKNGNYPPAQIEIARMLSGHYPWRREQNHAEALALYMQAAERGHLMPREISKLYLIGGLQLEPNFPMALHWKRQDISTCKTYEQSIENMEDTLVQLDKFKKQLPVGINRNLSRGMTCTTMDLARFRMFHTRFAMNCLPDLPVTFPIYDKCDNSCSTKSGLVVNGGLLNLLFLKLKIQKRFLWQLKSRFAMDDWKRTPEGLYYSSKSDIANGNYLHAVSKLECSAQNGHLPAFAQLASILRTGQPGIPRNHHRAFMMAHTGSQLKCPDCTGLLALMYQIGERQDSGNSLSWQIQSYYPLDYNKSRALAQTSADSGSSIGKYVLANFQVSIPRVLITVNHTNAIKMYRDASSSGENFDAMFSLAVSLFDDPMFDEEVFHLLLRVERSNSNCSVYNYLGICFETGKGCNRNLRQALYNYRCLERSNCRHFFECHVSRVISMIREVRNASKSLSKWRPEVGANGWPIDLFDSDNDDENQCICDSLNDGSMCCNPEDDDEDDEDE